MHRVFERRYFVAVLSIMLSSCSMSVRSLQPEEIASSKADEILFFATDKRIIWSHPDSCFLAVTDSQRLLHIQGMEYTSVKKEGPRRFEGDLATSTIDSIEARYRPSIYHAGPMLLVLSAAAVVALALLGWGVTSYW